LQAGGHRFDPVRLHQFPDLSRKNEIENESWGVEPWFFGCLTLWIGCKARLGFELEGEVALAASFEKV
jgi:hypothetical protein